MCGTGAREGVGGGAGGDSTRIFRLSLVSRYRSLRPVLALLPFAVIAFLRPRCHVAPLVAVAAVVVGPSSCRCRGGLL